MNVYIIDPTFVRIEFWKPLISLLKVKKVYSFFPKSQMPSELYSEIKDMLRGEYRKQNKQKFAESCSFWLRGHLKKYTRLLTDDYPEYKKLMNSGYGDIPEYIRRYYSSNDALSNIDNLEESNCLVLAKVFSKATEYGVISAPHFYMKELYIKDLPTYICHHCLSMLSTDLGTSIFQNQCAFILFDEFFQFGYKYEYENRKWCYVDCNGKSLAETLMNRLGVDTDGEDDILTPYGNRVYNHYIAQVFEILDELYEDEGGFKKRKEFYYRDYQYDDYDDYETYERYRGSYAQDVAGYSDQDIDSVFEGDPSYYWNID